MSTVTWLPISDLPLRPPKPAEPDALPYDANMVPRSTLDDVGSRALPCWVGTGRLELYWPLVMRNREGEGRR